MVSRLKNQIVRKYFSLSVSVFRPWLYPFLITERARSIAVMRIRFSPKVTFTCLLLAIWMIGMSVWQWERHLQKQDLIETLNQTLRREPIALGELIRENPDWEAQAWRRVSVSGSFDFSREFLLRNRSFEKRSGFHVITPLKIDGAEDAYVLVDRGFLPLGREEREYRKRYQTPEHVEMFGLIKNSASPKLFAPNDPEPGANSPWVDKWLRVDIPKISKQLPYTVLPIYLETMNDPNDPLLASHIVRGSDSGRHDVLNMTDSSSNENFGLDSPDARYPVAVYDTTPPPDIHLGYVYEWAFMALLTLGIGLVLQLRRPHAG